MTAPQSDSSAGSGRRVAVRAGRALYVLVFVIGFAIGPALLLWRDVPAKFGATAPAWLTAAAIFAAAVAVEAAYDGYLERLFHAAVLTAVLTPLLRWLTGVSNYRVELSWPVLLAELLVYVAALATAALLVFHVDWGRVRERLGGERGAEADAGASADGSGESVPASAGADP